MKIKKQPDDIFKEYEKAVRYNENIDLYDTVEKNQRFYKQKMYKNEFSKNKITIFLLF